MLEGAECCITNKRKKGRCDKRRFSDEQIRCLEVMFESETKLEPRKKIEVARELGLQPRQVAIWFQNKRARWKSKHIEKEYSQLLANYNALASQFESLKKEKNSLLLQVGIDIDRLISSVCLIDDDELTDAIAISISICSV